MSCLQCLFSAGWQRLVVDCGCQFRCRVSWLVGMECIGLLIAVLLAAVQQPVHPVLVGWLDAGDAPVRTDVIC
jgi:hypothetical protein